MLTINARERWQGALVILALSSGAMSWAEENSTEHSPSELPQPSFLELNLDDAVRAFVGGTPQSPLQLHESDDAQSNANVSTDTEIDIRPEEIARGRSGNWPPVAVESVSRAVSYSDLDLTRHADVIELRGRIERTAKAICDRLHEDYWFTVSSSRSCFRQAVADAADQMQDAIARAAPRASGN